MGKYLCQMISGGLEDNVGKITISIDFTKICDSEREGRLAYYNSYKDDRDLKIDVENWTCENCYLDFIEDSEERKCLGNCNYCVDYDEEVFKHTHTKKCLCPYNEGIYYGSRSDEGYNRNYYKEYYDQDIDKIMNECIESGEISDEFLDLFFDKLDGDNNDYTCTWSCIKLKDKN